MKVTELGFTISLLRTIFVFNHVASVLGGVYDVADRHKGSDFLTGFRFEALGSADPTHGRVDYVDGKTAAAMNLTFATEDSMIIKVDSTKKLDPSGPGRPSVRLRSTNEYTTFVVVAHLTHMPQGCGTWPALWTLTSTDNWPAEGEIDIMEGTNDLGPNAMTLHTSSGCMMPHVRPQAGTTNSTDCNAFINFNQGCSVQSGNPKSFGPSFNKAGGGWVAAERSNDSISVWFWSSGDPNVPKSVSGWESKVDTSTFGIPDAFFPNTFCDIPSHFGPQNIVIDCTLCGDLASVTYATAGCPGDCVDFVNTRPEAFVDAYWEFKSITVYT
ncbi:hypothetical protein AGABI1DRAFT_107459 [Agaricus bisporus var. burnettii JB137-S8]|uniref:GH16 domain-containing protein n=1 Tax=Agaricus bisporus var. burnettii (strain JB137-S8 / ATCC MYA-4627 / FGSC 10392) TaxID=597362 RepID=K5XT77_AGABU|nr:uncharacterized protein AGABI1DRAFT_107459 [Agaricus bisporus var. burnettii JB137-S8]EKM78210.1 hypothetical protein AGABI1DRAFT_107459 [Agaricus bisporus var. burnettii JB137-S8]